MDVHYAKGAVIVENYEDLEGKEIDCFSQREKIKGFVVGCDPDIGITIVAAENPKKYLMCLSGLGSSLWEDHFDEGLYKYTFDTIVSQFKIGIYDDIETRAARNKYLKDKYPAWTEEITNIPTAKNCPFRQ